MNFNAVYREVRDDTPSLAFLTVVQGSQTNRLLGELSFSLVYISFHNLAVIYIIVQ